MIREDLWLTDQLRRTYLTLPTKEICALLQQAIEHTACTDHNKFLILD